MALFDHGLFVFELRLFDGNQVFSVQRQRIVVVHDLFGHRGQNGLSTHEVIDDGTRSLARTEAGELVLLRKILIGLADAFVDVFLVDRDGQTNLIAFQGFNISLHRLPPSIIVSVPCYIVVRVKGLEPSR